MVVTNKEIAKLNRIMKLAEQLVQGSKVRSKAQRPHGKKTRIRRTGRELIQFRKMLKACAFPTVVGPIELFGASFSGG